MSLCPPLPVGVFDGGRLHSADLHPAPGPIIISGYGSTAASVTRMNFGLTKSEAVLVENALRLIAESDPERAEAAIALRGKLHDTVAKQLAPVPADFLEAFGSLVVDDRFVNRSMYLQRSYEGEARYAIQVETGDDRETIHQLEEFATAHGFKTSTSQESGRGYLISLYR